MEKVSEQLPKVCAISIIRMRANAQASLHLRNFHCRIWLLRCPVLRHFVPNPTFEISEPHLNMFIGREQDNEHLIQLLFLPYSRSLR
jgi:hypothetical protein